MRRISSNPDTDTNINTYANTDAYTNAHPKLYLI
jgi:hypothetical protein